MEKSFPRYLNFNVPLDKIKMFIELKNNELKEEEEEWINAIIKLKREELEVCTQVFI